MRRVAVDANVFVSYLTGRHEKQCDAARVLLQEAEDGNLVNGSGTRLVLDSERRIAPSRV